MTMKRTARRQSRRQEGLKADYRGATPEQVARAVLMYRPKKPAKTAPEPQSEPGNFNPSI